MKRKGEREEKYGTPVLVAAKELAGFTMRVTMNEKNFPKRYRYSITDKMQNLALEVLTELTQASEIYPDTDYEFALRRAHMKEARAAVRALIALAEVAVATFPVKPSTFAEWARSAANIQKQIAGWIRSDDERFSKFNHIEE